MKKIMILLTLSIMMYPSFAGNKDRAGQAGASELLINPWARASGLSNLGQARVRGIESSKLNIAGLAFTKKLELTFARSIYLAGSDISVNALGLAISLGENAGVLGVDLMSLGFGEIMITTTDLPDGGTGTFKPQFANIGISYAKTFSNSIHGGLTIRTVTEKVSDVSSMGIAIDAGIQYVTGKRDNIHFGIALKNVGTPMKFSGDGLTFKSTPPGDEYQLTLAFRGEKFDLPSALCIGGAYDFYLDKAESPKHRLTTFANYTSNSFSRDQYGLGLEYSFRSMFMIRGAYNYEQGLTSAEDRTNVFTGLSGGVSVEVPTKKDGPTFGIDYSYRTTNPFNGTHTLGLRLNL